MVYYRNMLFEYLKCYFSFDCYLGVLKMNDGFDSGLQFNEWPRRFESGVKRATKVC